MKGLLKEHQQQLQRHFIGYLATEQTVQSPKTKNQKLNPMVLSLPVKD